MSQPQLVRTAKCFSKHFVRDGQLSRLLETPSIGIMYRMGVVVHQDFKNEKYHVIQDPGSKLFKDTVNLGVFSARKKAVILREYQSDQKVLLHEMGHYVDLKNNFGSLSQEFIQIYHLESKKIDSLSYSRKDSKEYFAEAFMMYCKYPYTLKNKFPKTYNYIAQTLQNI